MVEEVVLGQTALDYIRGFLEDAYTLSRDLLRLPLATGRIVTHLPPNAPPAALIDFRSGGVLPSFPELESWHVDANGQRTRLVSVGGNPVYQEIKAVLADFIADYLQGPGRRYAVFEDTYARPDDASPGAWTEQWFSYESEVYLFLTAADVDPEIILRTWGTAHSYRPLGILVAGPDLPDLTNGQAVTAETLQQLTNHTDHLIIGVYDGEGELLWSKPQ